MNPYHRGNSQPGAGDERLSYRDGHFQELKVPLTWTVAVAVVVAAVIAVALLISDRRETLQASAYGAARAVADTVQTPAGEVIAAPGRLAGEVSNYLKDYVFAASENRRLRQEVAQLQGLRDEAAALRNVNERYKALLGFRTEPPVPMVAARVVLDVRGPFSDTRLADAGKERGVKVGDPVMSDRGLVGRVIGVTNGASRILLLTDVASRTPVLIDRTDARAILTGDSSSAPKLDYLRGQNPVRDGDRVLTSGDGGLEPRGLPVGTVVKGLDGAWPCSWTPMRAPSISCAFFCSPTFPLWWTRRSSRPCRCRPARPLRPGPRPWSWPRPRRRLSPIPRPPPDRMQGRRSSPDRPRSSLAGPPYRPRSHGRRPARTTARDHRREAGGRAAGQLALDRRADPDVRARDLAVRRPDPRVRPAVAGAGLPDGAGLRLGRAAAVDLDALRSSGLGLFLDMVWGSPAGLWSLSLIAAYVTVLVSRNMMSGQSRTMMWIWFAAACAVAIGLAYLATTWDSGVAPNLLTTLWQLLPTMMLYPFSHRLIERFEDADPRFR